MTENFEEPETTHFNGKPLSQQGSTNYLGDREKVKAFLQHTNAFQKAVGIIPCGSLKPLIRYCSKCNVCKVYLSETNIIFYRLEIF